MQFTDTTARTSMCYSGSSNNWILNHEVILGSGVARPLLLVGHTIDARLYLVIIIHAYAGSYLYLLKVVACMKMHINSS